MDCSFRSRKRTVLDDDIAHSSDADESGANQRLSRRLKWTYDIVPSGQEVSHTSLPRLVEAEDGSQDLLLGEIKMTPPREILKKECEELIDMIKENNGQIFLRLSKENEERFFSLCEPDEETNGYTYTPIRHVHASGTLEGWGCEKGRRSDPQALQQATFLSLYNLMRLPNIVTLPVSLEIGGKRFVRLRVSVVLKAAAITRGALPANVLQNLHAGRKYASDLRNVLGWLLPSLVDMGAQVPHFQCIYTNEPRAMSKHAQKKINYTRHTQTPPRKRMGSLSLAPSLTQHTFGNTRSPVGVAIIRPTH
jgi:hypothetical protein